VTNSGGDLGTFTASLPAVAFLSVDMPSAIPRAQALAFSWTPDPNAETVTLVLDASYGPATVSRLTPRGTITCSVPESAQTVTVDPCLLANFQTGDTCWVTLTRETRSTVHLRDGDVTFATQSTRLSIVSVE
jgi:hypothetical protein